MTDDKLYSTGDISRMYGVSINTLARAIRLGKLPAIKVGQTNAVKLDDVKAWMENVYRPDQAKRYPSKVK